MEVFEVLNLLENTPSKNEKEAILSKHKDNENLKECFRLAYSPTVNFFMKKIPAYLECKGDVSLSDGISALGDMLKHSIRGYAAQEYVSNLLTSLSQDNADVIINILRGDLRCGVGKATINKVWKNLIVTPPRQGAKSMSEKSLSVLKNKRKAVELKSDGSYMAFNSTLMSRNGNPITVEPLEKHLRCGAFDGFALEGEGIFDSSKAIREVGNGIVTKIVKGTASDEEKDGLIYQVWDCIAAEHYQPKGKYPVTNEDRRLILEDKMKEYLAWCDAYEVTPKIQLIPRQEVSSIEEAFDVFEGYVRDGFEGAILKDMDAHWADNGKPSSCVKMKRKDTADLLVVGVYEGEGKATGTLGGINLESSDGIIKVNCGSGFSDQQRQDYYQNQNLILGKIVEVEYDSVTEDKNTLQKSLFLPIFKGVREDKLDADNYEEILAKVSIK